MKREPATADGIAIRREDSYCFFPPSGNITNSTTKRWSVGLMLDFTIWFATILLEILIIGRSLRGDYFKRYPIFYSYISFILLQSAARFTVYHLKPDWYPSIYWFTEFVAIIAGCSVVFEFCRLGLKNYPGVAKMARAGLIAAFLFTFSKVLFTAAQGAEGWTPALTFLLERDIRFVQIAATAILVAIVLLYRIPMSRNLKGIILGYGFYLGTVVTNLTFLGVFGERIQSAASRIQASSYMVTLLIWTATLWSYASVVNQAAVEARSYSTICEETNEQLAQSKSAVESILP